MNTWLGRSRPSAACSDCRVHEIGGNRLDAAISPGGGAPAAHLPALGDQVARQIIADDAAGTDDESGFGHARPLR